MSLNSGSKRERSNSGEGHQVSSRVRTNQPLEDGERERIAAAYRRDFTPEGNWPRGLRPVVANGRVGSNPFECVICGDPDTLSNPRELYAEGGHVRFPCDHRLCWRHARDYQIQLFGQNPRAALMCALCRDPNAANQLVFEENPRVPIDAPLPNRVQIRNGILAARPARIALDEIIPADRGTYRYTDPSTGEVMTWPDWPWEDPIYRTIHQPNEAQVWFRCQSRTPHRVSRETFELCSESLIRRPGNWVNPATMEVQKCLVCLQPCHVCKIPEGGAEYVPFSM